MTTRPKPPDRQMVGFKLPTPLIDKIQEIADETGLKKTTIVEQGVELRYQKFKSTGT